MQRFRPAAASLLSSRFHAVKILPAQGRTALRAFCKEAAVTDQDNGAQEYVHDPKDRSRVIPLEVSMLYMDSVAFRDTYGGKKVWELYRRNLINHLYSFKPTRKTCIRNNRICTASPCPICRDEYLVVDYRNVKLLNQFVAEYNGQILSWDTTNVCQKQHLNLLIAIEKARDHGLMVHDQNFIEYDYSYYKPVTEVENSARQSNG